MVLPLSPFYTTLLQRHSFRLIIMAYGLHMTALGAVINIKTSATAECSSWKHYKIQFACCVLQYMAIIYCKQHVDDISVWILVQQHML